MAQILLIDDDDDFRGMLRKALELDGHAVQEAGDGHEGMARARHTAVDLMITDILMPGQDGLETIHTLRQEFPRVKIIAISGGGQTGRIDMRQVAKRLGAARTLWKPFTLQALREAIHEVLQAP